MNFPVQLIREGIVEGDWAKVSLGYLQLTGEEVSPPPQEAVVVTDKFLNDLTNRIDRVVTEKFLNDCTNRIERVLSERLPHAITFTECVPSGPKYPKPQTNRVDEAPASAKVRYPNQETDYSKFNVQHGDGRAGKTSPFIPGMTNLWKDDGTIAADEIEDSRKMSKAKEPQPRRPAVRMVSVTCCKCGHTEEVSPVFAPKTLDRGEQSSYVCNDCIRKVPRE